MNRIIGFALRQRLLVCVALAVLLAAGGLCFARLNIEAYPDPVPPLVDIITQNPGQSAEEIERYITIPVEVQMAGIPHVTAVRSISLFGLSDIKLQFTYDFTYEQAEQWVINRLAQLPALPGGAQPQISPSSPIGEIYRYRVTGPPGYSVTDLKEIQDWLLERRLKALPGVIDVNGWGGSSRTYDVAVDLHQLEHYGLSLQQVLQSINSNNVNVGGQTLSIGSQSAVVRGVGLIESLDEIRNTVVAVPGGAPVLVSDIAQVTPGYQPRLGIAGQDGDDDVVQGIVLMRRGEQSLPTIARVQSEIDRINTEGVLPAGVGIRKIYDRSELIAVTIHTVLHNMLVGMLLIFLVQWVFLGNLRSALIVAATIPFALSFAVILLVMRGESANLLSVGAIDFGLIVDATVIMVENIYRHLAESRHQRQSGSLVLHRLRTNPDLHGKFATIGNAALEVSRPIFFSAAIIIAGFLPLFTLSGIEGHIFGPMAKTYAYAIAGGLLATFTVSPALSSLLLEDHIEETDTWIVSRLRRWYQPIAAYALSRRAPVIIGTGILFALAALAVSRLGLEFMPKLEEGNLWIRATLPASISLEAGNRYVNDMRRLIAGFSEVETAISQNGRPDDGTDATGFFNAEFYVPLKPANEWPAGLDKPALVTQVNDALMARFPGVTFNFSQNIEDNVEEASSGVKGENSVKLYGPDLRVLEQLAGKVRDAMSRVSGVADLAVLNSLGQPTVRIDIDRARAARFGLNIADITSVIQSAVGGQSAGNLYRPDSDRNFPIIVRLAPRYRDSLEAIGRITVAAPAPGSDGKPMQVPLSEISDIRLASGAAFIYREGQERYIPVTFSVRGRDLGGAVLEAQKAVSAEVRLPPGYRMEWVGELGNLQEALQRLAVVVPVSLGLICLLLYANFSSLRDALLAASVMPMALVGGVLALWMTGTPFSVSAAIGFVALFGIAAMDGIIVVSYFKLMAAEGLERREAILHTCQTQMRPVLMTCVAACAGLLPAALSNGIGSQVQKPLALVVVGGITLAPLLILVVLPVLIDIFSEKSPAPGAEAP